MPTICVRGINFADTKDWTHEELQDLIGSIFLRTEPANKYDSRAIAVMGKVLRNKKVTTVRIGYLPHEVLSRAHRENWCKWGWEAEEIGRFKPKYSSAALSRVFCKISDRETHIMRNIASDEDDGPKLTDRMQSDDSLYDGRTCVCIHYDSKKSGLGWRDVVLLSKTKDKFIGCDGSSDVYGRPIPQKIFNFAQLKVARQIDYGPVVDDEEPVEQPAKRAKVQ